MFPYSIIYTVQCLKCIVYYFQSQGRYNFNLCNNYVLSLFLGKVQYCTLGMIFISEMQLTCLRQRQSQSMLF